MKVEAEKEARGRGWKDHDLSRRRTVVIGRRWPGNVAGRRRHPIGLGTILDVGELVGASGRGCGEKQNERGHKREEQLFHH